MEFRGLIRLMGLWSELLEHLAGEMSTLKTEMLQSLKREKRLRALCVTHSYHKTMSR